MKKGLKIGIAIIVVALLIKIILSVAPGNYSHAERYTLNGNIDSVISIIENFKNENPEYNIPKALVLEDKKKDYWFFIYFYYQDKNQILCTWLRSDGKTKTTFAFVSVNEGLDLGNWKDVNNDFGFFENRRIKKEFEEKILDKIKENIKKE